MATPSEKIHEPAPMYRGRWRTLFVRPDLASAQTLAVGIVVYWDGRLDGFKLLADFTRIECLYHSPPAVDNIRYTLERAQNWLHTACVRGRPCPDLTDISPHFEWGEEMTAQYSTSDEMVDDLYRTVIALDPTDEGSPRPRFVSRDTAAVRRSVRPHVLQLLQMKFERVWVDDVTPISDETGHKHWLQLDVISGARAGALASAWFKDPKTIEFNMLKADRDIRTWLNREHARGRAGVFVLRPTAAKGLTNDERKAIDKVIDEVAWKIRAKNCVVEVEDDERALAERIVDFVPL